MTTMKDIRSKSDSELVELAKSGREAIRGERFKGKQAKDVGVIRANKQDIARALTELNTRRNAHNK